MLCFLTIDPASTLDLRFNHLEGFLQENVSEDVFYERYDARKIFLNEKTILGNFNDIHESERNFLYVPIDLKYQTYYPYSIFFSKHHIKYDVLYKLILLLFIYFIFSYIDPCFGKPKYPYNICICEKNIIKIL